MLEEFIQFATNLAGDVQAMSDPYPGSWHDSHAYTETGWAGHVGDGGIGDKAYVGTGLVTPKTKPQGGELSTGDKDCNKDDDVPHRGQLVPMQQEQHNLLGGVERGGGEVQPRDPVRPLREQRGEGVFVAAGPGGRTRSSRRAAR